MFAGYGPWKQLLELIHTFNQLPSHCVKSIRIRSYSGLHFPAFGLNNSEYGHFLCNVGGVCLV